MIARGGRRAGVGHERRHRFTAWMGVLVLVPALLCACHRTSPPPVRLTFAPSGLDGGGFVNVVAYDPSGSGVVLAGGDVSGIQRSTDFGRSWAPANTGIAGLAQLKIASLLFSPRVAGEVYAAVGDEGRGGGLLVSTDDGRSWALRSDVPNFSGGNNVGTPLPPRHPRSTGTLLAADPTRDILYAATFHDGVMRSDDDGRSWTTLGLAGSYLRGLALDSGHPDVLYAAAFDDAVYRTAAASSTGTMARLDASPRDAEELAIVGNGLYAAAGRQGLLASSDGGSTWRSLLGADQPDGSDWEAIAGYEACARRSCMRELPEEGRIRSCDPPTAARRGPRSSATGRGSVSPRVAQAGRGGGWHLSPSSYWADRSTRPPRSPWTRGPRRAGRVFDRGSWSPGAPASGEARTRARPGIRWFAAWL